ncbi:ABC transporter permease [Luteimonas sp. M1R5S18]|jgi:ABC-2 type transport system permease protein|uniref:Transport permease protein n=1 Tax=Luteimonas rhizosphaericola TaxID=3042024 RepID=A0ABT6JMB0_9GAMM|nr:ABC transporter permease [Luteimonas rhizosphaericola]MDH5831819.1 ABC transporter permease [Luteimonas rhizosphaericola]
MSRSLFEDYRNSLRHPEFWAYSSWLDIATRHRRTRLGFLWFLVPTIAFLLVLGNVYSQLMGYPREEYLPYLGVGFVVWRFMLQIVNEAVAAMTSHKAFIMDGRTRLTDFVLRSFAKAAYMLLFGMIVVMGILMWSPSMHVYNVLTLVATLPILLLNLSWIAVCLALLGARFRDMHEIMGTILIVAFLITPVLWTVERFPPDTLRGTLVRLNPAFHMIDVVRAPVLGQMPEATSFVFVGVLALVGWPVAALLYRRYARFVPIWV